jgi:hypothetical protein
MSRIFAAVLLGTFTILSLAPPAGRFTRQKIQSFAELDRALAVGANALGADDISLGAKR